MTSSIHDDAVERAVLPSTGNPTQYTAVARALVDALETTGTTVNGLGQPFTGDGFFVAASGYGQVLEINDDDLAVRVLAWVLAVAPVVSSRADYFYGVWSDHLGGVHLDVSQHFSSEDRQGAVRAVLLRGEQCGWDAGRKVTI